MSSFAEWKPKISNEEAVKLITAPGSPLELETMLIDGSVQRVYKNLWPSLRVFWLSALQEHGDKTYVVYEDQRYTFKEIHERVLKAASIYRDVYGVKKVRQSDVFRLKDELTQKGLRDCFRHPRAQFKWYDWNTVWKDYRGDINGIMTRDPQIVPEDNATIIFTSGTTGLPKGVLSTQRAFLTIVFNVWFIYRLLQSLANDSVTKLRNGDSLDPAPAPERQGGILLATPLFHVTGSSVMLFSAIANSPAAAQIEGLTFGGAPVPSALAVRTRKAYPKAVLSQAYGMTETNATVVSFSGPDYETRWESCGRPSPVNDLLIMQNGKKCPPRTAGEIWIRGPNVMKGYWGDPVSPSSIMELLSDATSKTLTKDGWCKTGDIGYLDEEGYLYLNGRSKDMIIRGGENIIFSDPLNLKDPVSVENALHRDERLNEVAAVGVPDSRLGELVTAVITVKQAYKGQVKERELIALAQKHLPNFAVPVMIIVYEGKFEHTPSEKIVKAPLRKLAEAEWKKRTADSVCRDELVQQAVVQWTMSALKPQVLSAYSMLS
ncbi:acetyl-CoA synthetase-like protein [Dendrothele bispora CBS 962.96]|uniref:Acetyl-CoA synthetase-like protein n=1 Tax=Dendrothele bispora (strain CBS 962.96) TaxID=1314807 RepID=A0A4V4HGW2_DENBC|nr:acetyl-CoA synthetase-like protein [Dendrothele bispora CBS 962.96]